MKQTMASDGNVAVDDSVTSLLSFACVNQTDAEVQSSSDPKKILLRVPPLLKTAWDRMCADRKISQTDAGISLIGWIVVQPPPVQSMILGQLPATPDLIALVLRRLAEGGPKEQHGPNVKNVGAIPPYDQETERGGSEKSRRK